MNYLQEFRNIALSEEDDSKKQEHLNDLMRNSPNRIHPNSQAKFDLLKQRVKDKIKQLEGKLSTASGADKKDIEARLKELKDAQKEFKVIEQSSTIYSFAQSSEPQFDFKGKSNNATVFYDGSLGSLINELKHVFQFESGQLEFIEIGNTIKTGLTYDVFDELATYKRQYAFDGVLKFNISLSESDIMVKIISKDTKDMGRIEVKRMKDIKVAIVAKLADGYVQDGLYERISQKELNINSSSKDVFNANKENRFDRILNISLGSADKKKSYLEYIKVFIKKKPIIYAKY